MVIRPQDAAIRILRYPLQAPPTHHRVTVPPSNPLNWGRLERAKTQRISAWRSMARIFQPLSVNLPIPRAALVAALLDGFILAQWLIRSNPI